MIDFAADQARIFDDAAGFGFDATYTPQGGDPVALRVMRRAPTEARGFDNRMISSDVVTFLVRKADVAAPAAGDTILCDGETRVVQGAPELDARRLAWRLDTRPG